jgi:hypothetical protein
MALRTPSSLYLSQPARLCVRDGPPQLEDEAVREAELFEVRVVDGLGKVHRVVFALA